MSEKKKKNFQEEDKNSKTISILCTLFVKNTFKVTLLKILLMNQNRDLKKGVEDMIRKQ